MDAPLLRGVVFDFDGLILGTEVPVFEAWRNVYADHGTQLDLDLWRDVIGTDGFDPVAHLESLLGRRPLWDEIRVRRRARRYEPQGLEAIRPGILDWLAEADQAGIAVGIASSSPRQWVVNHLERVSLAGAFGCIRCQDDAGAAKPSPASYLAVLEALAVEPVQAIAVEDSVHGVAAASTAGMHVVAVPNSRTRGMNFSAAHSLLTRSPTCRSHPQRSASAYLRPTATRPTVDASRTRRGSRPIAHTPPQDTPTRSPATLRPRRADP